MRIQFQTEGKKGAAFLDQLQNLVNKTMQSAKTINPDAVLYS